MADDPLPLAIDTGAAPAPPVVGQLADQAPGQQQAIAGLPGDTFDENAYLAGNATGWTDEAAEYTGENTDGMQVRYDLHQGTKTLRPASGDGPGEVIRLHADYYTKSIQFSYERVGDWPLCPSPFPGDPNLNLISGELQLIRPRQLGDSPGGRVFRASGLYHFEVLNGLEAAGMLANPWGPFQTGVGPESTATGYDNVAPIAMFDPNALALAPGVYTLGSAGVVTFKPLWVALSPCLFNTRYDTL